MVPNKTHEIKMSIPRLTTPYMGTGVPTIRRLDPGGVGGLI